MKKATNLGRKWLGGQSLAVLLLIALMLAVTYFGQDGIRTAAVSLPMKRVDQEGGASSSLPPASAAETAPAQTPAPTAQAASAISSYDAYRLTLVSQRAQAAKLLDEVIGSDSASPDIKEEALRQKTELARCTEVESTIETLLAARGFPDALCTVRKGSVHIIIPGGDMTQQQAAQIMDIAMAETGEPAANVRIIPSEWGGSSKPGL